MKTDLFQSCGHCWVFQICWYIECSTFTASSFRIWNSSTGIPSAPLAWFVVMLSKTHLISHSRMSGSRWVITPSLLSGSWRGKRYYRVSLVAQLVNNPPTMQENLVQFLSQEDPLEKGQATHSSTLAWKIPWTEEPGRLQSMGSWRVGHDWATSLSLFTFVHWRRKWQPTPVFLPGESQGRGSLLGCCLWGRTESDTTEVT